jgi:hypothetical protein
MTYDEGMRLNALRISLIPGLISAQKFAAFRDHPSG